MKLLIVRVFPLLLAVLGLSDAVSAQSHFTRTNPAGPYAVGFRVVEQYDRSRGYRGATDPYSGQATEGERARPLQTLIWYPAEKGTGSAVRAEDYLRLGATADDFGHTPAERARLEAVYISSRVQALSPERAKSELAALMLAYQDARPTTGSFPVVIYAPSYRADAAENADLCEYLASHGYVVIASPSIGQTPRGMTDDLEGAEAQVGDIEFLIGYAHGLPQADTRRLAVIGYSWGGLANVMAAAKDSRILALVALDGSVRTYPAVIEQSRYLTPARVTAPLLYVAATPKQVEDLSPDVNAETSFLNRLKYADLYRVTLAPYVHANFSVMGQRYMADDAYGNYNKDELSSANGWLERFVRNFLDGYLKGDAAGRAFLNTPGDQIGAPPHLLTTYVAKAQGASPTRDSFAVELARQGFDQASAVYARFKQRDSSFALSEGEVNAWGYRLMRAGNVKASLAILRLNAELHGDSWNAFDSLGEAYAKAGDKPMAVESFRKSLAMNPTNTNAVAWLKQLGAKP
jgi:dienelactone hydrolase